MKKLILPLIAATALALSACNNGSSGSTPVTPTPTPVSTNAPPVVTPPAPSAAATFIENNSTLITSAASIATGAVLNFAETDPAKRVTLANEIWASASALNSLATGTIPTVSQVQKALTAFGGNTADANYAAYAQALAAVYATYFAKLSGDGQAAVELLDDLITGAQEAASAYATVTSTPTSN